MTEPEKTLMACPQCKEYDALQTIERIMGYASAEFFSDSTIDWEGHTEMDWDSSKTIGIYCKHCGWEGTGASLLVPYVEPQEGE